MSIDHSQNEIEFVLRNARESDVKFIRLWFTDILGNLKGFAITIEDLEDALLHGVGFDGAAIEGFARDNESDVRAFPDPSTFAILPWRPKITLLLECFATYIPLKENLFQGIHALYLNITWNSWLSLVSHIMLEQN